MTPPEAEPSDQIQLWPLTEAPPADPLPDLILARNHRLIPRISTFPMELDQAVKNGERGLFGNCPVFVHQNA